MKSLNSVISKVTVFTDRAQIIRRAKAELTRGDNLLFFEGLPDDIDTGSIQVTGEGSGILKDINIKREHFSKVPDKKYQDLNRKKRKIKEELAETDDEINLATNEKNFVENIAKKITNCGEKENSIDLDPEKWMKMVDFYRSKIRETDQYLREKRKKAETLKSEIERIKKEIDELNPDYGKARNNVELLLTSEEDSEIEISLSYIVFGAGWIPIYDLRVSSEEDKMEVSYNAKIRQSTGEDWNGADLFLSTARPMIGGDEPELNPWMIDVYKPEEIERPYPVCAAAGFGAEYDGAVEEMEVPDMVQPVEASVQTHISSYLFRIPGKNTIISDNSEHTVIIALTPLEAKFNYSSVPKLTGYAFLKSTVKNTSGFHFLPGEANVFLDNSFVSKTLMGSVSPDEEFETSLGIDEGINIKYSFLRKYQKNDSFFHKKNRYIYQYEIEITNNKKRKIEIEIKDQLPVSQSEYINVSIMEPKYEKDSENLTLDRFNLIKWKHEIEIGKKVVIPFTFSVEYSKELEVTGLD